MKIVSCHDIVKLSHLMQNFTNQVYRDEFCAIAFQEAISKTVYKAAQDNNALGTKIATLQAKQGYLRASEDFESNAEAQSELMNECIAMFSRKLGEYFNEKVIQRLALQYSAQELLSHISHRMDDGANCFVYVKQSLITFTES